MRLCVGIGLGVVVGIASMVLLRFLEVREVAADCKDNPCVNPPCCNGDVNGDAGIDISDVMYLCNYLFLGTASEPPAMASLSDLQVCQAERAQLQTELDQCKADLAACVPRQGSLPATGQTKCYDTANPANEIDCANADFPGQDAFYKAGCASEGRFIVNDGGTPEDNRDDTVTDTCTGLMWQKETADVSGDGKSDDADQLYWQDALKYCENLSFGGHTDWRLPNVRELASIIDYGREPQSIDPVFGGMHHWYWSSSMFAEYPGMPWGVDFGVGRVSNNASWFEGLVRAVRNAP